MQMVSLGPMNCGASHGSMIGDDFLRSSDHSSFEDAVIRLSLIVGKMMTDQSKAQRGTHALNENLVRTVQETRKLHVDFQRQQVELQRGHLKLKMDCHRNSVSLERVERCQRETQAELQLQLQQVKDDIKQLRMEQELYYSRHTHPHQREVQIRMPENDGQGSQIEVIDLDDIESSSEVNGDERLEEHEICHETKRHQTIDQFQRSRPPPIPQMVFVNGRPRRICEWCKKDYTPKYYKQHINVRCRVRRELGVPAYGRGGSRRIII